MVLLTPLRQSPNPEHDTSPTLLVDPPVSVSPRGHLFTESTPVDLYRYYPVSGCTMGPFW